MPSNNTPQPDARAQRIINHVLARAGGRARETARPAMAMIWGVATACLLLAVPASRAAEPWHPSQFQASSLKPPLTAEIEQQLGPLRFKGAVTVTRTEGRFFGWSGFWVSPDGSRFSAVNDGDWAQGTLSYDGDGNLASLTVQAAGPLLDDKGTAVL